jgi:hypothetical protein
MAVAREEENAGGYSSDGLRDESSRERTAVFSAYAEALEALIQVRVTYKIHMCLSGHADGGSLTCCLQPVQICIVSWISFSATL